MDKVFIFLLCFYLCFAKIIIKNLDVPSSVSVEAGEVILDCEFDAAGDEVEEIKWFFGGAGEKLIYQWLPKRNSKPQAAAEFKNHIDINYKATQNTATMFRALRLIDLSPELSGDYMCKVSGFQSEDIRTKKMIVYDPADEDLYLNTTEDNDHLTIECSTEGIFPEPEMRIVVMHYNDSNVVLEDDTEDTQLNDDGTYNVSSVVTLDLDEYESPLLYTCELTIPGTDYVLIKNETYEFESDKETQTEEDFLNLLNSTNSTESSFEELQDFETQIEENSENILNSTATASDSDDDDNDDDDNNGDSDNDDDDDTANAEGTKASDDSSSFKHLPSFSLITTLLLAVVSSSLS